MATIPEITDRLEAATEKAENASQIIYDVANGDASTEVPTASGPTPTLKKWFQDLGSEVEPMLAGIPERLDKAILSYPDYAAASAAAATLPDGQMVVSEYDEVSGIVIDGAIAEDRSVYKVSDYAKIRGYTGRGTRLRVADLTGAHWWVRRGAALDNGGTILVDASGRSWEREFSGAVNVAWFGAIGDGITDSTSAIQSAANFANSTKYRCIDIGQGWFRTSALIDIPQTVGVNCWPGCVIQNISSDRTFPCFRFNGGGRKKVLQNIVGYAAGFVVKNSTNLIEFHTISNCLKAFTISATDVSSLDNKIVGIQIGLCDEGIVFEQSGKRIQQGNEIRINFVSETLHTLVFDDMGTHSEPSNWDSNFVEIIAVDPYYKIGATLAYNKSAFPVPALNYSVKSWAGGWNLDDGTITLIKGRFSASHFEFSFASRIDAKSVVDSNGRASFDSCQFRLLKSANNGAGTGLELVNASDADLFNAGVQLFSKRFRVSFLVPALASGQSSSKVFMHALSTSSYGGRFKIVSAEMSGVPYILNIRQVGSEKMGMVRLWALNPSANTISEQTINLIIEAGD